MTTEKENNLESVNSINEDSVPSEFDQLDTDSVHIDEDTEEVIHKSMSESDNTEPATESVDSENIIENNDEADIDNSSTNKDSTEESDNNKRKIKLRSKKHKESKKVKNTNISANDSRLDLKQQIPNIGISLGSAAVFIYIAQLVGGFIPGVIILALILLCLNKGPSGEFLVRTSVKALALDTVFTGAVYILEILTSIFPNVITTVLNACNLYDASIYITSIANIPLKIVSILTLLLNTTKYVLFVVCAFASVRKKEVGLPIVDNIYSKITKIN